MAVCAYEDCGRPVEVGGRCRKHYTADWRARDQLERRRRDKPSESSRDLLVRLLAEMTEGQRRQLGHRLIGGWRPMDHASARAFR